MVSQLRSRIESVLLVVDAPVAVEQLASALGATAEEVSEQLRGFSRELAARGSGMDLRETVEGWRLYTRTGNAEAVEAFLADPLTHQTFPAEFVRDYADMKRREWDEYQAQVGEWERAKYLLAF